MNEMKSESEEENAVLCELAVALGSERSFEMHAVHDVVVVSRRHMYLLGGYYSSTVSRIDSLGLCVYKSRAAFLCVHKSCVTRPSGLVRHSAE